MHTDTTRRDFLRAAAALGGLAAASTVSGEPLGSRVGAAALSAAESARARNVIFFVIDGMDHASVMLADLVARRRDGRASAFVTLRSDPGSTIGQCMTHSRNSLVTDSAAAGSAFGIGEHIDNRAINVIDGRQPAPILTRARDAGFATGLVTTTRITHATPAAMACNAPSRDQEDLIATQLLERRVDVLLGGGAKHFQKQLLDAHFGYAVARTAAQLDAAPDNRRLLGLFNDDHLNYELDRPATQPSLAQMTHAALGRLDRAPNGFLLQIEAGRVDHAGHANDAAGLVHDMLASDRALDVVADFCKGREDTLLIVAADHGTGGPQLTKYGEPGAIGIDRIASARKSFEWIIEELGGWQGLLRDASRTRDVIEHAAAFDPGRERVEWLIKTISERARGNGFDEAKNRTALLGSVLANGHAVGFTSVNHNPDYVEVFARGPGSERLARLIDNVDIHRLMCEQLGLPLTA